MMFAGVRDPAILARNRKRCAEGQQAGTFLCAVAMVILIILLAASHRAVRAID